MVDLKSLKLELEQARRARMDAETAGSDIEHLIERMRAGRTLQQIELEEPVIEEMPQIFRQAA